MLKGDMTEHFSRKEFKCPCGCGRDDISSEFVFRLEDVFTYLQKCEKGCKYIMVNSGVRCSNHSISVGGYGNDMHTKGRAADIYAIDDNDNFYNAFELAAVGELFGFGGIGIINKTAVHFDDREKGGYSNNHWFGNEQTGENYNTFVQYLPAAKVINTHKISLFYDDKEIFKKEV